MRLHPLKSCRIGVSLACFALIAFLFLDLKNILVPGIAAKAVYLQFVPSLMHFLHQAAFGATGWIVVILLTVLFGRIYCSTICPLGTFQDIIGFLARQKHRRRGFSFTEPYTIPRYCLLALTVLLLIAGSGFLLNLLDPFSGFGRILADLIRPIALFFNNLAAMALEQAGVYTLAREQWATIGRGSAGFSLTMLAAVTWLAATRGRLYCNTVCPVGALLGLVAKVSWLRLGIDHQACRRCGRCEAVCKAGCIDSRRKRLDISRCVGCYNCLAVCEDQGLRFEKGLVKRRSAAPHDPDRRDFLRNSAFYLLSLAGIPEETLKIVQAKATTVPPRITSPVSPPGSASIERFTATCTACHLCVSACPSRVLVPSFLEFGLSGLMQPRLNYHAGHCNYECTICLEICPTGALQPLAKEDKKLAQLGVAKFIKDNCVVHTDHTACGACSEHCPTKAVSMVPYPNPANKPLTIPEVTPDYCIGCGGCEHACPTRPYKAVYVDGNPVHKLAKKPLVKKIEIEVQGKDEEFPF